MHISYTYMCVYMYTYICICMYTHVCRHICICFSYVHMDIPMYMQMNTYIDVYICMYISGNLKVWNGMG